MPPQPIAPAHAAGTDFGKLDEVVVTHNHWFPIKANLPIDLRTGAYLQNGRPKRLESVWSVERVRALLDARG